MSLKLNVMHQKKLEVQIGKESTILSSEFNTKFYSSVQQLKRFKTEIDKNKTYSDEAREIDAQSTARPPHQPLLLPDTTAVNHGGNQLTSSRRAQPITPLSFVRRKPLHIPTATPFLTRMFHF
ncbi:unnamed protein product [Lathyrus sativus]|nr:unnamed protein product [Lathyrus sativus]